MSEFDGLLPPIGGSMTREELQAAARKLPEGYVITVTIAGEVGVGGVIGVEGSYTDIYTPNGEVHRMYTGAGTAGTPSVLPAEFVGELGIAYVGDDGVESLEGLSVTVEGGVLVGIGVTSPAIGGARYNLDLIAAASSGDREEILSALATAPEGSIVFLSSGIQASAGLEVSYSILSNSDNFIQQDFSGEDYWTAFDTVIEYRVPVEVIWQVDYGNGQTVTFTQIIRPGGDRRDGSAVDGTLREGMAFQMMTSAVDQDGNPLSVRELRDLGIEPFQTGVAWNTDSGRYNFDWQESCFSPDVLIDMWPLDPSLKPNANGIYDQDAVLSGIWRKRIEDISPDDLVVSFDASGRMVPALHPPTSQCI